MVPASGDAHKIYIPPLAGIRSRIDSSACGNAIKILHPLKRRFCIYFGSWSPRAEMHIKFTFPPRGNTIQNRQFRLRECHQNFTSPQAEMHMKIYISPSREYYPAPTIPLAEVQPKYCIPASGGLLLFQFLSPLEEMHRSFVHSRERKCEADAASPLRGNASGCVQYRKQYCT